jgi:Mn2+/Fe2+ NRAMP family transporter
MSTSKKGILKALGPGILFASTAIGVSHLVQSTRAGSEYGFALLWAVLLANLFKYPFFEYGSRYASATGTSIIDGYKRIGTWMLVLYFIITLLSMFFVVAAVGAVTIGFMDNLFGITALTEMPMLTPILLFTICITILMVGKYKVLDSLIKIIGAVLLISTLLAFFLTLSNGPAEQVVWFEAPKEWFSTTAGIAFVIALMGWMPTAVDLSTWNSLWTIERMKQTGYRPTLKETLFDFNFGYLASALLSICFVTLGAFLIYGTGQPMPKASGGFANSVVNLYTQSIGSWSYIIIAAAAFSIMFSTCIAVFDGYARAMERTSELLFFKEKDQEKLLESKKVYNISLLVIALISFFIIYYFLYREGSNKEGFKALVDLAITISFVIAPIIAIVNFVLVGKKYVDKEYVPPKWMKALSYGGILFLTGFTIFFLYVKITATEPTKEEHVLQQSIVFPSANSYDNVTAYYYKDHKNVVNKKAELTPEQVTKLISSFYTAPGKWNHKECSGPHHLFVFSQSEKPVLKIWVGFDCGQVDIWANSETQFTKFNVRNASFKKLAALVQELGLPYQ